MSDQQLATRIESRIDKTVSASTGITQTGAMAFASVEQIMEFAKVMAIAGVAVPKHLRENVGACLAVAIQASEWQMSPFAVASKTYVVNDRIAFEAQLVNAVILRRAPIAGRFKIDYSGEGPNRRCKVSVKLTDGDSVDYESPLFSTIPVKNSPLWKGDPDQQLFYYSSRAMCRRHFPDVLLGIYTPDELSEAINVETHVTALPQGRIGAPAKESVAAQTITQKTPTEEAEEEKAIAKGGAEKAPEPPKEEKKPEPTGPKPAELRKQLIAKGTELNAGKGMIAKALVALTWIEAGKTLDDMDATQLAAAIDGWEAVAEKIKNPDGE